MGLDGMTSLMWGGCFTARQAWHGKGAIRHDELRAGRAPHGIASLVPGEGLNGGSKKERHHPRGILVAVRTSMGTKRREAIEGGKEWEVINGYKEGCHGRGAWELVGGSKKDRSNGGSEGVGAC